jgi:ADP-ribosylglycohydrolase
MNKDQVIGMFLGTAVGDALGMPVETFTPEQILEKYPETNGRITDYILPTGHKWFDGRPAGTCTDDTQLSLCTARGLIKAKGFDMDAQVEAHIAAYKENHDSWGRSTRKAIRDLANGVSWKDSGASGEGQGRGNGVPMKIGPVAALLCHAMQEAGDDLVLKEKKSLEAFVFVRNYTFMTHKTEMALVAAFAQVMATFYCLTGGDTFASDDMVRIIKRAAVRSKKWAAQMDLEKETDDIAEQFNKLESYKDYDIEKIIAEFGGEGSQRFCCYWNMPFTYAFFLKGPHSIETLYDIVGAGGDADSNGSILGSMLGALNGASIFPSHLIEGLDKQQEIRGVAEEFCDTFGIK